MQEANTMTNTQAAAPAGSARQRRKEPGILSGLIGFITMLRILYEEGSECYDDLYESIA